MAKHCVVIVGGGFGGLHAAKSLDYPDVEVTLLDRRNFHLFQPLLYQVATGGLSPGEIAAPLRAIFENQKNLRVLMTEVTGFEPGTKHVETAMGPIPYDTLILAAGATSSYFGNEQWAAIAPPLKSIEDATGIRGRMLTAFEEAEKETDPDKRRAWLTFLIVGGGPTGVELAGALGEIANDALRKGFRRARTEDARILILDSGPRVLSNFSEKLSQAALETLAVIAYKQPIMRAEVEKVRGVACGEVVRQLMEKGLVRVAGRHDSLGRPQVYGTTKKFLQAFGLNAIKDLPEVEALRNPGS